MTMKGIINKKWLGKPVNRDTNCVEITVNLCTCHIESVAEDMQILRFIANGDPNFPGMPDWLLNNAIKMIALVFLKKVASKAKDLSDEYKRLINSKRGFYDQVKDHIDRSNRKMRLQDLLNGGTGDAYAGAVRP